MEGIQITLAKLTSTAQEVRALNSELTQELSMISQIMKEVGANWQGLASDTTHARFARLEPAFENYREIIDSYAQFLEATAASYEATEQSINQSASSL